MGSGKTTDTVLDVYGSPGEYCGAFNMGTLVRVHNHAQNFTGMVMHSGVLEIHGDAGKVTGYSSKGGTFNILGNVVDRGWVCAVSDPARSRDCRSTSWAQPMSISARRSWVDRS